MSKSKMCRYRIQIQYFVSSRTCDSQEVSRKMVISREIPAGMRVLFLNHSAVVNKFTSVSVFVFLLEFAFAFAGWRLGYANVTKKIITFCADNNIYKMFKK